MEDLCHLVSIKHPVRDSRHFFAGSPALAALLGTFGRLWGGNARRNSFDTPTHRATPLTRRALGGAPDRLAHMGAGGNLCSYPLQPPPDRATSDHDARLRMAPELDQCDDLGSHQIRYRWTSAPDADVVAADRRAP